MQILVVVEAPPDIDLTHVWCLLPLSILSCTLLLSQLIIVISNVLCGYSTVWPYTHDCRLTQLSVCARIMKMWWDFHYSLLCYLACCGCFSIHFYRDPLLVACMCRYDFAGSDGKAVTTKFHWHAHAVRDLCFTTDGKNSLPCMGYYKHDSCHFHFRSALSLLWLCEVWTPAHPC